MRIFGLAGWSGSGKTTLLTRLLPVLAARRLRVSTLKHAHHAVDLDVPGKDTWRHREAGAHEVMLATGKRFALLHELHDAPEPGLADLLSRMAPVDLVLVEGFKHDPFPKLEVHATTLGKPLLAPGDPAILAIATDRPEALAPGTLPPNVFVLDREAVAEIAELVIARAGGIGGQDQL
jgi:molybdopterin-guanine dinucleotide biosynthesis protein B